nr:40S ribosomal protein S5 [Cajanus cajan]
MASLTNGIPLPKLTKDVNYDNWKVQMKALLGSQDNWDVVENGHEEPVTTEGYTNAQLNALKVVRAKDKAALYLLYRAVDESGFEKIANAKSSKEAWDILEKAKKGDERVKQVRLQTLRGELENMTMAEEVHDAGLAPDPYQIDVKLFNRWSFDDVQVNDISLADYIGVVASKHATYVPHTAGRYSVKRKAQCPIVERLTNSLMMHGRNNGKKLMAVRIIKHAMEIIHLLTDLNPIQVIVDAVINSGPREDATRIGSAGVVRRQAVDISPLRRVNQAIYLLTTGAREAAFRNIKTIAECLADELINAAKGSSNSYAIKKKDEIERVAKANR